MHVCCSAHVLNQLCPIVKSLMFMRIPMCVRLEVNLERINNCRHLTGSKEDLRNVGIKNLKNKQRKSKISNRRIVMIIN